jgi:hypothetical protein
VSLELPFAILVGLTAGALTEGCPSGALINDLKMRDVMKTVLIALGLAAAAATLVTPAHAYYLRDCLRGAPCPGFNARSPRSYAPTPYYGPRRSYAPAPYYAPPQYYGSPRRYGPRYYDYD